MMKENLEHSPVSHLCGNKIVIAGGGAKIIGLRELTAAKFLKRATIVTQPDLSMFRHNIGCLSTIMGLMYYAAAEHINHYNDDYPRKKDGAFRSFCTFIKNMTRFKIAW